MGVIELLSSKVLIGRKFWIKNELRVNMNANIGTIVCGGAQFSGAIKKKHAWCQAEAVKAVIENNEVGDYIRKRDELLAIFAR